MGTLPYLIIQELQPARASHMTVCSGKKICRTATPQPPHKPRTPPIDTLPPSAAGHHLDSTASVTPRLPASFAPPSLRRQGGRGLSGLVGGGGEAGLQGIGRFGRQRWEAGDGTLDERRRELENARVGGRENFFLLSRVNITHERINMYRKDNI